MKLRPSKRDASQVILISALVPAGLAAVTCAADVPRAEHPKPQFMREARLNLNGPWGFAMDPNVVGLEQNWRSDPDRFNRTITVPFCLESKLSGIVRLKTVFGAPAAIEEQ